MKRQRFVLASLAAVALAYGASRSPHLCEPAERSLSVPSIGENAGAPTEIRMSAPAAIAPLDRLFVTPGRVTAPASPEWPVTLATASEEEPRHLGKLLDADSGKARESTTPGADPISIDPPLDADDPRTYDLHTRSEPPSNIGEPLDADDSKASPVAGEASVSIGPDLDADNPEGWDFAQPAPPMIEIGEILDAGPPRNY